MFRIEFYESASGRIPVEQFLLSLDNKMRTKAIHELMLLREKGNALREPYSKALADGLFELRIQQSGNAARIFYFFFIGSKIVLTNGFIKKTPRTPTTELDRAKRFKADYERRHNG